MAELKRRMIQAIRSLQKKTATAYDLCDQAPVARLPQMAIGPRGGTLVTRHHVAFSAHYEFPASHELTFIWGKRTVTEWKAVGNTDIAIGTLDSPAPDDVQPCGILPHDWQQDLRVDYTGYQLRRPISAISAKANGSTISATVSSIGQVVSERHSFGAAGDWQPGDSGQPVILPLPTPILLGCLLYVGAGHSLAHYWRETMQITVNRGTAIMPAETWFW